MYADISGQGVLIFDGVVFPGVSAWNMEDAIENVLFYDQVSIQSTQVLFHLFLEFLTLHEYDKALNLL